jgi:hypothetical protein
MFRRFLAVLLVGLWVLLSQVDLLEDFGGPNHFSAYCANSCGERPLPPLPSSSKTVNNIVESAHHNQATQAGLFKLSSVQLSVDSELSFKKAYRLHKLHHVFLI